MNKWNDNWRYELELTNVCCYDRLCECRNTKEDVMTITKLMHKYNNDRSVEECLDRVWEWLGDWNGQFELSDWIDECYHDILNNFIGC